MTLIPCLSGGMSELELTSITNDAVSTLTADKITVRRIIVGTVMVRNSVEKTKPAPSNVYS